jgi:hypothetical protein
MRHTNTTFTAANIHKHKQQITKLTNKTIVISESSTVSGFDVNKQTWYANAWHSIAVDFPRVAQVTWFLYNKNVSTVPHPHCHAT